MGWTRRTVLAGGALLAAPALAQEFPARSLSLVISYPPGGIVDSVGRRVAEKLSGVLGKPVVAENRPGAGGNVAASAVAKAAPDGHTLLFTTYATLAIAAAAGTRLDFDPLRSLQPVAAIGPLTVLLVVRRDFPAQTVEEFVAYARAHPGQVNFGSIGVGSSYHLALEQLKALAGLDITHVPYRGGNPAMTDLIAGRLDAMLGTISMTRPQLEAGSFRALAVANADRAPGLALPTITERAAPGTRLIDGLGVFAPAGLPGPVLAQLNGAVNAMIAEPAMRDWLVLQGTPPTPMAPEAFATMLREDTATLAALIRQLGLQLE